MSTAANVASRLWRIGWKLILVALIVGFVIYRVRFAPVLVEAQPAVSGPIASEVLGTGTLEPRVQVTISAKISGRIVEVRADQADRVTRGELLVVLDDRDLRQQVEMAGAEVEAIKASVERAGADITRALANATQTRASYKRSAQLAAQKLISDDDFDKATQQRDVAEAELTRAQLARNEAERQVIKAEATLGYYRELLTETRIASPFDGLVIRRIREPGDIVVPGTPILQVIATDRMWVSAWVDESALAAIGEGQPARVLFRSQPDTPSRGTVTRIAPLADRETRQFIVDVTVEDLPPSWAVGQRAEVYIETARKDSAVLVPQRAIMWQANRPGIFIVDAGVARWREVTLGLRGEQHVEITDGVNAGDVVILRDSKSTALKDGRAVKVVSSP